MHACMTEKIFLQGETLLEEGKKAEFIIAIISGQVILTNKENPYGDISSKGQAMDTISSLSEDSDSGSKSPVKGVF